MADYRALAEQDQVGRFVAQDGTFVYVNPRLAALTGIDREELHGRQPVDVFDFDGDAAEALVDGRDGPPEKSVSFRARLDRADRRPLEVTVTLGPIDYGGAAATLGVVVSPTSWWSHAASILERATSELVRATTRREVHAVVVETVTEVLGFDVVSVHALEDGKRLVPVASNEESEAVPEVESTESPIWDALLTDETTVVSGEASGLDASVDLFVAPLGDTELLLVGSSVGSRLDEREELLSLLATSATAALDRVQREERLERLHEATRDLMAAETESDVAAVAVATARDVLRHDLCGIHLYDADRDALVPVAASDRTREFLGREDGLPALERGDSLGFEVFETGEPRVYDRLDETPGVMDPTTPLRSELIVPLGDRGVFLAGSVIPAYFDETDVSLAKVLCANVEAALERAEREEAFREQEAELRAQNSRLDEFASVVSHDLRNPLNVATGRLELVRELCTREDAQEHLDAVAKSHSRMEELIDDLLTLARQGRGVGETERVDVGALARKCWEGMSEGTLEVVDEVSVEADRSRLRELLENLVRNSVEHAGPEPRIRLGALGDFGDADTDADDSVDGFFLEDDGPGIPPETRERVFEHGYSTDTDGTGFGLSIVRAVADAHGWEVRVTEGTEGGARFEFRF
jgi:PAS domain S-box-containing protein